VNLKEELQTQLVGNMNLSKYCVGGPDIPVREAVANMRKRHVSVCLIVEDERLVGILTDRDVLRRVADHPETWDRPVRAVMTPDPITIPPDASAADALWLMDEKQIRDLPALGRDGEIVGNMTHQAVVTYLASRFPIEILNLPPEPDQYPDRPEGG
jgi:CBS domain-containing protein